MRIKYWLFVVDQFDKPLDDLRTIVLLQQIQLSSSSVVQTPLPISGVVDIQNLNGQRPDISGKCGVFG